MPNNHLHETNVLTSGQTLLLLLFLLAGVCYLGAAVRVWRTGKRWPLYRLFAWMAGITAAVYAVAGPPAAAAHHDFQAHMLTHLLLGMLAPLLLVLAAPVTLALRTMPVPLARRFSRLLKSRLAGLYNHPVMASILNIGGLWLLYRSGLYTAMMHTPWLHTLVHIHVFAAGYLFTASIIGTGLPAHRFSFPYRTGVLLFALAAHGILAKHLYAYPLAGIPLAQAEAGAVLMYYGGDAVDLLLIALLFQQWFYRTRLRRTPAAAAYT